MADLPSNMSYFFLKGQLLSGVTDGPDVGHNPDGVPRVGLQIMVRTLLSPRVVTNKDANVEIDMSDIYGQTDSAGQFSDSFGNKFIGIIAPDPDLVPSTWKVTVTITDPSTGGYTSRSKTFVPVANTPETALDWTDIFEVTPSPGVELEQWTQLQAELINVRSDTIDARDDARLAAQEALAFAGNNNEQVAAYVSVSGPSREAVLDVLADGVPAIVAEAIADDPSVVASAASLAQSDAGLARVTDFVNTSGLYAFPGAAGNTGAATRRIVPASYPTGTSLEGQVEGVAGSAIITRPTDSSPRGAWVAEGNTFRCSAGTTTVPLFVSVGQAIGVIRTTIAALRPVGQAQGFGGLLSGAFPAANTGTVKYLRWALSGTSRVYVIQKVTGASWYTTTATNLIASSVVAQVNDAVEFILADGGVLTLRVNGAVVATYTLTSAELTEYGAGIYAGLYASPQSTTEPAFRTWEYAPSLPVIARKMVTAASDGSLPAMVESHITSQVASVADRVAGVGMTTAHRRGYGPQFEDAGVTLVTRSQTGLPTIYTPHLYDMRGIPGWTGYDFLLGYSTDHDTGTGGVGLAGRNGDVLGAFTPIIVGGQPRIYVDTVEGNSTETPFLWYFPDDPDGKPHYMYYQQDGVGGRQATLLAKASNPTDPASWTRVGVVIQKPQSNAGPGDGQSTYPSPFPIGDSLAMLLIDGGGPYAGKVLYRTRDGISFTKDPYRFADRTDLTGDTELRFVPSTLFRWRAEWWSVLSRSGWGSGLWDSTDSRPYVARMSDDLKSIISKPRPMIPGNVLPAGVTQIGAGSPVEIDGYLYVAYRANNATTGSVRIMRAKV